MIKYTASIEGITGEQLRGGFFEGWPNPPLPEVHLKILAESDEIVLAVDIESGNVVGFVNSIADGFYAAYVPLLEVLPAYRGKGIGGELVRRLLTHLKDYYMIDLICLPDVQPFYAKLGMLPVTGMVIRNFERQAGKPVSIPSQREFKPLETARLVLRRFRDSDLSIIVAYRNNPEVARYQRWSTTSETGLKDFIEHQKILQPGAPDEWFQFAIESKATKELIGDCALKVYKEDDRQGEIGFTLGLSYQGQGFATEAVSALLDYAFTKLGLYRIFAFTACENRASISLLERLGMRREGHILQSFQWKGERRDEYLYAILKDEWLPGLK